MVPWAGLNPLSPWFTVDRDPRLPSLTLIVPLVHRASPPAPFPSFSNSAQTLAKKFSMLQ